MDVAAETIEALTQTEPAPGNLCAKVDYERGMLRGWVTKAGAPLQEAIRIEVDGSLVWKGQPRRQCEYELDGLVSHAAVGFRVEIPHPAEARHDRLVSITTESGEGLPGLPLTIPYGDQFVGAVVSMRSDGEYLVLAGWCVDVLHPAETLQMRLETSSGLVFTAVTNQPRPEAADRGFDAPNPGFTFRVPLPEPTHQVRVYPGKSLIPLDVTEMSSQEVAKHADESDIRGTQDTDEINGSIDEVSRIRIRGWARNSRDSEALVVLDLHLDGVLYATTTARRFRADLAKAFSDHGCHEFIFELTPDVCWQLPGVFEVVPRVGRNGIKHKQRRTARNIKRNGLLLRSGQKLLEARSVTAAAQFSGKSVALIVINRNGASLLETLLASLRAFNTQDKTEIIVVDHASTDHSDEVVNRWASELTVRMVKRDGNYSFSSSNNLAASLTSADVLVFVNNDVRFCADILPFLRSYAMQDEIGCVGVQLLDDSPIARADENAAIQHLAVCFQSSPLHAVEAYEVRSSHSWRDASGIAVEVPAVTAALMACRKEVFDTLGGFDEGYFYGQEDVDFCLKVQGSGLKVICANDLVAFHLRAYSRDRMGARFNEARSGNKSLLDQRFGFLLKEWTSRDRYQRPGFWSGSVPKIAFVVTEATDDTLAGDYFTALELAQSLTRLFACDCAFLEVVQGEGYDLSGFDVVIAMRDDFDPRKIVNPMPHLIRIAWVRNWFDRFLSRESALFFDAIWSSSNLSLGLLERELGKPIELLPIATNQTRFSSGCRQERYVSDYCFTGSYWGKNREIIQMLDPSGLPFECAIYGAGWEAIPHLRPYWRGALPYAEMPNVYASTKIVIDDANHVTKKWGAVNSRVFDAIAAGALVLTNGVGGSEAAFAGRLPTFNSPQELEDLLWAYLTDENKRKARVDELQSMVLDRHTYEERARQVWNELDRLSNQQLRISVKIGAPTAKVCNEWGDYHFAMSLKYALEKHGHTVRVDCKDQWYGPAASGDDVVIVLRGLDRFFPKPHQVNIMWSISHPDTVSNAELLSFDHIFVASEEFAGELKALLGDRVSCLLQCTDHRRFNTGGGATHQVPGCSLCRELSQPV